MSYPDLQVYVVAPANWCINQSPDGTSVRDLTFQLYTPGGSSVCADASTFKT